MALDLTAYVTTDEYRARAEDKSSGNNTTLEQQLTGGTRLLERSLSVMPGAFLPQDALTFDFDGYGGQRLRLRDGATAYLLRSVTSIGIDSERDGTFDGYTLTLGDAWVRGYPVNASALGEPFTALDILGRVSGATPTQWPDDPHSVRITGDWGWASTPEIIKDYLIHLVHDLQQAHQGGLTLEIPSIEAGGLRLQDDTWRLWREIKARWGRKIPAVA